MPENWRVLVCSARDAALPKLSFRDPEGIASLAPMLARIGETDGALRLLESVVARGFHCTPWWRQDKWLEGLREEPRFVALLQRAEAERRQSIEAYMGAGGKELLGVAIED